MFKGSFDGSYFFKGSGATYACPHHTISPAAVQTPPQAGSGLDYTPAPDNVHTAACEAQARVNRRPATGDCSSSSRPLPSS